MNHLINSRPNSTCWIIGTGPSCRFIPPEFFYRIDRLFSIGLNQAYKLFPVKYAITIHPELVGVNHNFSQPYWLFKKYKAPKDVLENIHQTLGKDSYCEFEKHEEPSGPHSPDFVRECIQSTDKRKLYAGRGIQATAMHLAALMGAKEIILIGCDASELGGEHHGLDQHTKFLGVPPSKVYAEYRRYTAMMRQVLREEMGVQTYSLSPFIGSKHAEEDYSRLKQELNLPDLPPPDDLSAYTRPIDQVG